MNKIYEHLFKLLKKTSKSNDIPVSAVIIDKENNIISEGYNNRKKTKTVSGHAEINAINKALKKLNKDNLDGYKLISTLEPCGMCFSAAKQVKLKTIEYILVNDKNHITRSIALHDLNINLIEIEDKKIKNEYKELLTNFFKKEVRK